MKIKNGLFSPCLSELASPSPIPDKLSPHIRESDSQSSGSVAFFVKPDRKIWEDSDWPEEWETMKLVQPGSGPSPIARQWRLLLQEGRGEVRDRHLTTSSRNVYLKWWDLKDNKWGKDILTKIKKVIRSFIHLCSKYLLTIYTSLGIQLRTRKIWSLPSWNLSV